MTFPAKPNESHREQSASQKPWTRYTGVKYMAFLVSIVALTFSAWQGCEQWKAYRLSVIPKLNFHFQEYTDDRKQLIGLFIDSVGIGPAVIKSFQIGISGKYFDTWEEAGITKIAKDGFEKRPYRYSEFSDDDMAKAGARYDILVTRPHVRDNNRENPIIDLVKYGLSIKVEYCSVYEECYHACWRDESCGNKAVTIDSPMAWKKSTGDFLFASSAMAQSSPGIPPPRIGIGSPPPRRIPPHLSQGIEKYCPLCSSSGGDLGDDYSINDIDWEKVSKHLEQVKHFNSSPSESMGFSQNDRQTLNEIKEIVCELVKSDNQISESNENLCQ